MLMTFTILEVALRYAAMGWHVIPVVGKVPVGNEWQHRATNNQSTVARLFSESPHDGVGVQLGERSNLIDFDCDSDEAQETFDRLFCEVLTPCYQSARGKHFLFQWTNSLPQGSIKIVVDGLEIRLGNGSLGCQSVFPPSGNRTWINDPDDTPLAEIPQSVVDRINARHAELKKPKSIVRQTGFSTDGFEGELNVPKWLAKHGREIIGRTDGSDGTTRWHIECPGIGSHTTPNSVRDCCVTQEPNGRLGGGCFHSSCGMRDWPTLRDTIGGLEWSDFHDEESTDGVDLSAITCPKADTPQKPKETRLPNEVFSVGGIIGRLLEHNQKTSLGPMPELALAGSISLMSVITGHKVRDFRNLRTNTYVISLAPSGAGKDDARKVNKNILRQLRRPELLAPTKIKSSAGMVSALVKQNPSLFQLDELSGVLRTMRDPERNPHMADVITVLLESWSEATGYYEPGAYADSKKNPVINQPHLCVYGTAVANEFWNSLTKRNLSDGLVGRLLVFEHIGYPEDSDGGDVESFEESLLAEVASWLEFNPPNTGNMKEYSPNPIGLEHTDAAFERYMEHRKAINSRRDESEVKSALWRRCNEKAGKLAIIAACSRCPPVSGRELKIELQDVNWGIRVANWLTNNMLERSQFKTADSPHEQNLNKILDILQDWTRKEIIGQRVRSIRADEREKIIRHAIQDGLIELREVETHGRKATEYRVGSGFNP